MPSASFLRSLFVVSALRAPVLIVPWLVPSSLLAAWPTRVLTAVEKERAVPELHLGLSYDVTTKSGQITREWIRNRGTDEAVATEISELDYSETTQRLVIDLRIGLFKDLEFHALVPFVLGSKSSIAFAEGAEGNSSVFGSANADADCSNQDCPLDLEYRYPITSVPSSRRRDGLGDITFGLAWSPVVDTKDESYPTITLRGDIIAPTGATRWPDDEDALPGGKGGGVGLGQTTFDLSLGVAKRLRAKAPTFDPYFVLGARIPVANGKPKTRGYSPPPSGRFLLGTEVIVFSDAATEQLYGLDAAVGAEYVAVGRTYSELSDYLPNFDQTKLRDEEGYGREPARYVDYANPANYAKAAEGTTCGILSGVPCGEFNRVDQHVNLTGTLALHIQPAAFAIIRLGMNMVATTSHLLTTERVGVDQDPASAATEQCGGSPCVGRVNPRNSEGVDERSRDYDPRYDAPGRRFRIRDVAAFTFFISGAARF